MDRSTRAALVLGAAVRVGVGRRPRLVGLDGAVGRGVVAAMDVLGFGDGLGPVWVDVEVEVQPAAAARAATTPATTNAAGFTPPL
jgi:hypothetical protein